MINGIRGKIFNEKDFIKLDFKIRVDIIKKLFRSKFISNDYTIKELLEDSF